MRITAMIVVLLLACGAAQAAEWVSVGKSTDDSAEALVDTSTILVAGDIRRIWVKGRVAPHVQRGTGKYSDRWVSEIHTLLSYNCAKQLRRTESLIVYYEDGSNSAVPTESLTMVWEPITRDIHNDTADQTIMDFTCAWKPTKQTGDSPSQNGELHLSDVDESTPAQGVRTSQLGDCGDDYYPSEELRQRHQGVVVVRVCIGIDNKIDGPVELISDSGFPSLDEAAARCMAAGRYRAATINGAPARACKDFKVTFALPVGR